MQWQTIILCVPLCSIVTRARPQCCGMLVINSIAAWPKRGSDSPMWRCSSPSCHFWRRRKIYIASSVNIAGNGTACVQCRPNESPLDREAGHLMAGAPAGKVPAYGHVTAVSLNQEVTDIGIVADVDPIEVRTGGPQHVAQPMVCLQAMDKKSFIVISTLCFCCASPAACCWCRVPAAFL